MAGTSFNIWSIIILLGAVQGYFLSFYLLAKKENRPANKWLAFLLIAVSLHLSEYAADISGITMQYPFFIAITYPLLFCMGPLYFFYCRSLLHKNGHVSYKTLLHFIPSALVLLLMLPFYLMPAPEKTAYMLGLSANGTLTIPTGQLAFMAAHVFQTAAYVFVSYKSIRKKEAGLKQVSADVSAVKKISWLKSFSFCFSVYLVLYLVLVIILVFADAFQVEMDYAMLLITSVAIYSIGYAAIGHPEIFKSTTEAKAAPPAKANNAAPKHPDRLPGLMARLLHHMETDKPYLKCDLKMSELADSLAVPSYQLSQFINSEFSVNFYDFINQYRVEEAKKLLLEKSSNHKMLAIAFETGFNSKATFNRVFKNLSGFTPSEFREKSGLNL